MFQKILAPVDLAHLDQLERALEVTASESRHHNAPVIFVSVTASGRTKLVNTPDEFRIKLEAFAQHQGQSRGIEATALTLVTNDPATEVDDVLLKAIEESGADLVVMASHKPGLVDYFWPSNGGKIASHSSASVLVVRDV